MICVKRLAMAVGCIGILAAPAMADNNGLGEAIHGLTKERGRTCFDGHFHYWTGSAKASKKAAIDDAVDGWRGFTAAEYGTDWAHFNLAANRKISCSQSASGVSNGFVCSVEARPCRR